MQGVTYSLKINQSGSDGYYNEIRSYTDEVLLNSANTLQPVVESYISYLKEYGLEEIRESEEYILELLSFGILWRAYGKTALAVKYAPFITLTKMSEWRKKHQHIKPFIDYARGILFTLFLLPDNNKNDELPYPRLEDIDHVCKWFEATGEFREQALRFIRWRAYWKTLNEPELFKIFKTIREFTDWFIIRSVEVLGKYTENVGDFIQKSDKKYKWREDRIQCTRSESEYHLNMVGAELMNRAFRKEYSETGKRIVLVPGCMRTHINKECKALKVKEGLICGDCTPKCNVNRLRHMGKRYNFDVYIIPHASDLSLWSPKKGREKAGIVATACVTTLVEGGWELKRYNVPAQCVLLDFSGCKKHWHGEGLPTCFNYNELKKILNFSAS